MRLAFGGGYLARFHDGLQPAQILTHDEIGILGEKFGESTAHRPDWRTEADNGADQGSAVCRGGAELHAAIHLHVQSGKRAPADVFVLTFIRNLSVPVDSSAHGAECRPAG